MNVARAGKVLDCGLLSWCIFQIFGNSWFGWGLAFKISFLKFSAHSGHMPCEKVA